MNVQKINSALKLLAFLLNVEGEVPLLRISQEAELNYNYKTVRNDIAVLKKYSLINERYEKDLPPRRLISLTKKDIEPQNALRNPLEIAGGV